MRRIAILVLVTAAAVAAATVALAAASPKAVRASIVAAALAQSSVHWASTFDGHGTIATTADVNADSGTEQIAWDRGVATVQVLVVDRTAYVKGNAPGLGTELGLTKAQATQYAGQWISVPKSDQLYAGTVDGLTLASLVHDATPRGKLKLSRTKSHGTRLLTVRGTSAKRFLRWKLTAHASGNPLPVALSEGGIDTVLRGRFSKWNEPVSVQAPASSTPIATVRGG